MASIAGGCVSAEGTVADRELQLSSGFFTQYRKASTGDTGVSGWLGGIWVHLTSAPDACNRAEGYQAALDAATDHQGHADAWEQHLGSEFWDVYLFLLVDDLNSSIEGDSVMGVSWDDVDLGTGEFWTTLYYIHSVPDLEYWEQQATLDPYADIFTSHGGELQISKHNEDRRLAGELNADVVWYDEDEEPGSTAGSVSIRFDVNHCRGVEDGF